MEYFTDYWYVTGYIDIYRGYKYLRKKIVEYTKYSRYTQVDWYNSNVYQINYELSREYDTYIENIQSSLLYFYSKLSKNHINTFFDIKYTKYHTVFNNIRYIKFTNFVENSCGVRIIEFFSKNI